MSDNHKFSIALDWGRGDITIPHKLSAKDRARLYALIDLSEIKEPDDPEEPVR